MVAEIEKHAKSVKVQIIEYNGELQLIREVMTKTVAEKVKEVREEERNKAQNQLKKLDLEHQAALKKAALEKEEAIKKLFLENQTALKK